MPGNGSVTEYRPSTKKMPKALKDAFKKMGLRVSDYEIWLTKPRFVTELHRDFGNKLKLALGAVWMALLEKAMGGDVQAMKLFLRRFDEDYHETKGLDVALVELPHKDAYMRVLNATYGEELVLTARTAAGLARKEGGHFDEEYLTGGALEDKLEEADYAVVDQPAEPSSEPETSTVEEIVNREEERQPRGQTEEEGEAGDEIGLDFLS